MEQLTLDCSESNDKGYCGAVSKLINIGAAISEIQELTARHGVTDPDFCSHALELSASDALVLTRCAADRPAWAIPAAMDLSDPLATKLLEMALRPSIRRLGGS